jgi:hypothetical protein
MYGISKETKADNSGGGFTGIQEGFDLLNITFGGTKQDGTGAEGLMFNFRKGEKFNFRATIFPINEAQVTPRKSTDKKTKVVTEETKAEAIARAYAEQASYVKHILTKFMPEAEVIVPNVSSFEAYAKAVIALAGTKYAGQKFRLKIVYNKKGYIGFPLFPDFIENMTTPIEKSKLKIVTPAQGGYDLTEKPVADADKATGATPINTTPVQEF